MYARMGILLFLIGGPINSSAQKQLIVLRNGNTILARYSEGSPFRCVLINGERKAGTIVTLRDFSMITSQDTIEFQSVARIDRRGYYRVNIMRDVGYVLLLGGLIYAGSDLINHSLGYDKHEFDQGDKNALFAASVGALMLYVKSPYRRLSKRMVMKTVDPSSPFFLKEH